MASMKEYLTGARSADFGLSILPGRGPVLAGLKTFRLPNGFSVIAKEDRRFPLFSARLFVRAGAAWEGPEESGISHLIEHMVFKGCDASGRKADERIEALGGFVNACTGHDRTEYFVDVPAVHWREALGVLRDLAFASSFAQEDLDAEREVIFAEMQQSYDSPDARLADRNRARSLEGTPYAGSVLGSEESLSSITVERMLDYMERFYAPRDMVLAIAGDVDAEALRAEIETCFGSRENRRSLSFSPFEGHFSDSGTFSAEVIEGPWSRAQVRLSFPCPRQGDPFHGGANILEYLLAYDDSSLLPRVMQYDEQIVDWVDAARICFERAGMFSISAGMEPTEVRRYLRTLSSLLSDLTADSFSDEELERARVCFEDGNLRVLSDVGAIARILGMEYLSDPERAAGVIELPSLRDVGRYSLRYFLESFIRPERACVSVLMPAGSGLSEEDVRAVLAESWTAVGEGQSESVAKAEGPEVVNMGEGRTLVLLPDRTLPFFSASLTFAGGRRIEEDAQEGLASLTASCLTTGTESRTLEEVDIFLAERSASLAPAANMRSFSLDVDAPSRFSAEIFTHVREVIMAPAFREEDVDLIRDMHLSDIESMEESASGVLNARLRRFLFREGPYSRCNNRADIVEHLTGEDVAAFWKEQRRMPWVLAVAGDFDRAEVEAFARSLPVPSRAMPQGQMPEWTSERRLELSLPGREQALYAMIFRTVGEDDPDRPALALLDACLNSTSGILFRELREKRSLGYSVYSLDWCAQETGMLSLVIMAAPENITEARQAFREIVHRLRDEELPENVIARAKNIIEAGFCRACQSREGRAAAASANILFGEGLFEPLERLEKLKAVTAGQIREAARKYLIPDEAYDVCVSPEEDSL